MYIHTGPAIKAFLKIFLSQMLYKLSVYHYLAGKTDYERKCAKWRVREHILQWRARFSADDVPLP